MLGGSPARNMVNPFLRGLPTDWSVAQGNEKNLRWSAEIGRRARTPPAIAGGKVFVPTDNDRPRDPAMERKNSVRPDGGANPAEPDLRSWNSTSDPAMERIFLHGSN